MMRRTASQWGLFWLLWACLAVLGAGCAAKPGIAAEMAPSAMQAPDAYQEAVAQPGAVAPEAPVAAYQPLAGAPSPATPATQRAQPPSPSPTSASNNAKASTDGDKTAVAEGARPMLIYEAQMGMMVDEAKLAETIEKIIDAAESKGGYLISRSDQTVAVRVPSQSLRAAMNDIEPLGQVTRRSVSAQDVSDQFHDLEVRLKSLEAVRERLQQFLSRATNMSEAMTIANQLDQVAQQIDQVKGQMQLLRTRAAYSLIQVSLQARPRVVVADPGPPPAPPEARPAQLPVEWLHRVGLDELTRLNDDQ